MDISPKQKQAIVLAVMFVGIVSSIGGCYLLTKPRHISSASPLQEHSEKITYQESDTKTEDYSAENADKTQHSATPTPEDVSSPDSSKIPTQIKPHELPIKHSRAGSVISLELETLEADNPYDIDLSTYSFTSLAISWSSGSLDYALGSSPDAQSYKPLAPADNIQQFEKLIASELIQPAPSDTSLLLKPNSDIDYLKIDLISPDLAQSTDPSLSATGVFNRDSGAKYTSLSIVSRDEWGANPASWNPYDSLDIDDPSRLTWQPYYHPISRIVVHHTATANNPSNPAAEVRSIYLYHTYSRGWGDIGYNYLIDQNGTIYEGKFGGEEVYGYHAYTEANAMSIGISMLGTFTSSYPTPAAQSALVRLMAEKAAFHGFDLKYSDGSLSKWLDSSYTVFGHRDSYFWCYPEHPDFTNPYICNSTVGWAANSTACPGDALKSLLATSITPSAQSYKDTHFATLKSVVSSVHSSIQNPHFDDVMLVKFRLPDTASEAEVLALIPDYSGISDISVDGNLATITVLDWNNGGFFVPPVGWSGYNAADTFFPVANGSDDRLETLVTIFRMDPNVEFAEIIGKRTLFE